MTHEQVSEEIKEPEQEPVFAIERMGIVNVDGRHLTLAEIGSNSPVGEGIYAFVPVVGFRENGEYIDQFWYRLVNRVCKTPDQDEDGGIYYGNYFCAQNNVTIRPASEGNITLDFNQGDEPHTIPVSSKDETGYHAFDIGDALGQKPCKDGLTGYAVGCPIFGLGMLVPAETIFPTIASMETKWIQKGDRVGSKTQKESISASAFRDLEFDLDDWCSLLELESPDIIAECGALLGEGFAADYTDAVLEMDRKTGSIAITLTGNELTSRVTINQAGDSNWHKEAIVDLYLTAALKKGKQLEEQKKFARVQYKHPENADYLQYLPLKHIIHGDGSVEMSYWSTVRIDHPSKYLTVKRLLKEGELGLDEHYLIITEADASVDKRKEKTYKTIPIRDYLNLNKRSKIIV